ncbi:MAG: hypothetical protein WBK91_00940 [Alphaproteobacteria bacterium]
MEIGLKEKWSQVVVGARKIASAVETAAADPAVESAQMPVSSFFGGHAAFGDFYFPGELVGGACPRVRGQEREIAWNVAAEACDSERVHMVWHATDDKVWYLAARAAEFSARSFTWCPFASLLPGMKDAVPAPVCYTYYSDEAATMMTVTADSLQIHRGTASVVRAKAERMVRELGGAKLVELDPDMIVKLTPVAWYSISLFEDRARRLLTSAMVLSGLACAGVAFLIWISASFSIMSQRRALEVTQDLTQQKTMELMTSVERLRASVMRDQIARFTDLNEGLVQVGGWLKFYQIRNNVVRWRAVAPASVTGERIKELGAKHLVTNEQGVLIGTDMNPADKR